MDSHYPEELLYTKEHEWCRIEDDVATIGITWHAQDALGDIVFCELPGVGETLSSAVPAQRLSVEHLRPKVHVPRMSTV